MPYTLPSLPYAANALEPAIDTMTMEIHHGRHHKAYVDNLNKALEGQPALAAKPIDQLMRDIKTGAGQYSPGRDQQRRRPCQPFAVLDDHGRRCRRQTDRPARRRHRQDLRRLRRIPGPDQASRPGTLRQRLVLAGPRRRQAAGHQHRQPGQPAHERPGRRFWASTCGNTLIT